MSVTPEDMNPLHPLPSRVVVEAPARLHLGFLDLHGGLGRTFGSLGLSLEGLSTRVSAERAPADACQGPERERALAFLELLRRRLGLRQGTSLTVESAIPGHSGLGSGTQLALATGAAVARLHGLALSPRDAAAMLDRGGRSGIGIGAFEEGGFLVDGGRLPDGGPPPVVSRLPFPEEWRVVLVFDPAVAGLHGQAETGAFRTLPPFPETTAAHLCRLTLMQALPALAERDLPRFGAAIAELQRLVGDHFAPAQGGRFTSPRVARVLALLESEGIACVGQSSWGPTGFAVAESASRAEALVRLAREQAAAGLEFAVCAGRNRGADILIENAFERRLTGAVR